MKAEKITAKVTFGKKPNIIVVDCEPVTVDLPTTVDELIELDVKGYGIDSDVITLFNSALIIRIQALMRAKTEAEIMTEFAISKGLKV